MSNKQAFIQKIATYAITDMKNTNIAASLTIAQAALESAWGASGLTAKANNLFGIKGKGPAGSFTTLTTEHVNGKDIKVNAEFRSYKNWGESVADHSKFILDGPNWNRNLYKKVIGVDGKTAAREIAKAGYATDPKYADKLIALMDKYNLYRYDIVKGVETVKKVWIDAGHGGKDSGAAGNGLKEKDIVLEVSLGAKKRLEADYEGVQVLLSRSTDVFLELSERTNKANKAGADILVSIHCNAGGGAGGFESFRYTNPQPASVAFQNVLHREIMATLKPFGVKDRGQKSGNLHMVRESKMPAVLTENLFIDVAADAAKLKRQGVIDALIEGHVQGIAKYLGLKKKEGASVVSDKVNVIVNGKQIKDGKLVAGVTYVPLRAVSEALGAKVGWDNKTKTATIMK
ncbi:MAG: N-acetylmuramoyl-L-alanine amidase [Bacillota bacterium]